MIFLLYTITQFKNKQAVSVETGEVLGFIGDLEIDCEKGTVANLVIYGKQKLLGLLSRDDDIYIPWSGIEVIGEETVLVKGALNYKNSKRKTLL